jgi:UDP-N-acetylmuramoylalanine--D-glutamate ligase
MQTAKDVHRDMPSNKPTLKGHYLVFGAARSGIAAVRLLRDHGVPVRLIDEKPASEFRHLTDELEQLQVNAVFGQVDTSVLHSVDCIILSPGVRTTHRLIDQARKAGIPILSELELGYQFTSAPIVGVTGTNGKTTTTTLIAAILRAGGYEAIAAGNIGQALCSVVTTPEAQQQNSILVVEISSFQLETIDQFHPRVALILNLTPDHLDRYDSMDHYIESKMQITRNQTADDFFIINEDDPRCIPLASRTQARVFTFSRTRPVRRGAYVAAGKLMIRNSDEHQVVAIEDIPIPGMHNVENVLAATTVGLIMGVLPEHIAHAVREFRGVEHRLEYVTTFHGADYYNDSKSTNLISLEKALLSFERPIILLAGGQAAQVDYSTLTPLVSQCVKALIAFGESRQAVRSAWSSSVHTHEVSSMEEAVQRATEIAQAGDIILLSPGHKSFDMYNNFEERGRHFKSISHNIAGTTPHD